MKKKVRDYVNKVICEPLENGEDPVRHKPWNSLQHSGATGDLYQGVNQAILQSSKYGNEYTTNVRHTFQGAKKKGGSVKKGESGTKIIFSKNVLRKETKKQLNKGEITLENVTYEDYFRFMRLYTIFNHDQTTLSDSTLDNIVEKSKQEVEAVLENNPHELRRGPKALYSVEKDYIQMPFMEDFVNSDAYYHVYLHELCHRSGHGDRLDRGLKAKDMDSYSREELVAEVGASYVGQQTGIDTSQLDKNKQYFKGRWKRAVKDSKFNLASALNAGRRASEYLLGNKENGEANQ